MLNTSLDQKTLYSNSGSRKTAVARAHFSMNDSNDGNIKITINNKPIASYFVNQFLINDILRPFEITKVKQKFAIKVTVKGGGVRAQSEAVRLAFAKILATISPDYKNDLRLHGLLTRDAREKERRKYGFKKARKRPQFSKR